MSLQDLPTEVLETVLTSGDFSICDLVNISVTSRRFYKVLSNSREVWRCYFMKTYPAAYEKVVSKNESANVDWITEAKSRYLAGEFVTSFVNGMSSEHFDDAELSDCDFSAVDDFMLANRGNTSIYIVDELYSNTTETTHKNLTAKYYGRKVLRHVKHRLLLPRVAQFVGDCQNLSDVDRYQLYEDSLIIISEWFQTCENIEPDQVRAELDHMAAQIFQLLLCRQIIQPDKIPDIQTLKRTNKTAYLSERILDATNEYMASEGFVGNTHDYYSPDNSFINHLLRSKQGIPITMSLMYACLVSRLGIYIQPVNFPSHFLLRWLNREGASPDDPKNYIYIDAFQNGLRRDYQTLCSNYHHLRISEASFNVASPNATLRRMLNNLLTIGISYSHNTDSTIIRTSLELFVKILPEGEELENFILMLARIYLQLDINHQEVNQMIGRITNPESLTAVTNLIHMCEKQYKRRNTKPPIKPKTRSTDEPHGRVQYWVGMVARHKRYNYLCVIYGWDKKCAATRNWIHQMGVDRLPRKDMQPFYNVLADDGTIRYAADENIEPCPPIAVDHKEVGKYFKEFKEDFGYIPNPELLLQYPEDLEIANQGRN